MVWTVKPPLPQEELNKAPFYFDPSFPISHPLYKLFFQLAYPPPRPPLLTSPPPSLDGKP